MSPLQAFLVRFRCFGLLLPILAACNQPHLPVVPTPPDTPPPAIEPAPEPGGEVWQPLFNGRNLDGWYTWLEASGKNRDPSGIFKIENGNLHVLDVPLEGGRDQGYLASLATYRTYHLRFEYRWGEKFFAAGPDSVRGGGLLYHVVGPDKLWPRSLELQVQEGDTGDLWLIDRTTAQTTVASGQAAPQYHEEGTPYSTKPASYTRLIKQETYDTKVGWNKVDLIVTEDEVLHLVNGKVNNRIENPEQPDPSDSGDPLPLDEGRIVFQAQNAEIFFRNAEIRRLEPSAP